MISEFRNFSKLVLTVILIISTVIHIFYLMQLQQTPYYSHPLVDADVYHQKALNIVEGNWIGDRIFFQAPFYPYFLAAIFALFGKQIGAVILIQICLSIISVFIIYKIGVLLFDEKTGLVSATLATFYGAFVFYSGFLLKATCSIFFTSLFLWTFLNAAQKPTLKRFILSGLLLGLCSILRGNFLLVFAALVFWVYTFEDSKINKIKNVAGFISGMIIVLAPITARNYYLEQDLVLINYDAGPSYFIGNNAKATGFYETFGFLRPHPRFERHDFTRKAEQILGKPLKPSEVSRFWFQMSLQFILEKPWDWLKLQGKKFALFINNYEKQDNYDLRFMKMVIPVLKIGFVSFGVILVLAVTGIACGRWTSPSFILFYIFISIYSLSVILFYINSRYRIPLIPALIPFAAFSLTEGIAKISRMELGKKFIYLVLFVAVSSGIFRKDHQIGFSKAYLNYGGILQKSNRMDEALKQYEKVLKINPRQPEAYFNQGTIFEALGHPDKSAEYYRETLRYKKNHERALNNLGVILLKRDNLKEAEIQFLKALRVRPDFSEAHYNLGILYSKLGYFGKAEKEFKRAEALKNLYLTP